MTPLRATQKVLQKLWEDARKMNNKRLWLKVFRALFLNETNSSTKLTLIWWNDCRLLVATTDSQMTIFLMGIQFGKLWAETMREVEKEKKKKKEGADT